MLIVLYCMMCYIFYFVSYCILLYLIVSYCIILYLFYSSLFYFIVLYSIYFILLYFIVYTSWCKHAIFRTCLHVGGERSNWSRFILSLFVAFLLICHNFKIVRNNLVFDLISLSSIDMAAVWKPLKGSRTSTTIVSLFLLLPLPASECFCFSFIFVTLVCI